MKRIVILYLVLTFAFGTGLPAAERIQGATIEVTTRDAIRILPLQVGEPRLYDSSPLREIEEVTAGLTGWQFTSIPQRIVNSYKIRITKGGFLYAFGGKKGASALSEVFGDDAPKWENAEGAIAGKNVWFCARRKVAGGEELSLSSFELELAAASINTRGMPAADSGDAADNTTTGAICGRWKMGNDIWVVSANGRATRSRPDFLEEGTWKCVIQSTPPTYQFNWSRGRVVMLLHLSGDQKRILGKDNVPKGARAITD